MYHEKNPTVVDIQRNGHVAQKKVPVYLNRVYTGCTRHSLEFCFIDVRLRYGQNRYRLRLRKKKFHGRLILVRVPVPVQQSITTR